MRACCEKEGSGSERYEDYCLDMCSVPCFRRVGGKVHSLCFLRKGPATLSEDLFLCLAFFVLLFFCGDSCFSGKPRICTQMPRQGSR